MLLIPTLLLALAAPQEPAWARPPLEYGARPAHDRVARLADALAAGESTLALDDDGRLLAALLAALDVPPASQTTVFTRTSFQARRVSARHPRALYFNDDVYIGYVPGGDVIELTAFDPREGLTFYTLTASADGPRFERQTHACLQCHAPPRSGELPTNLLRSLHPAPNGQPVLRAGSRFVDHTTPYAERWGGWYVTGDTGDLAHLGNQVLAEGQERLSPASSAHATLADLCDPTPYPAATSDVVALLVLEHQTHVHDVLARSGYEARRALHDQRALNAELGLAPDAPIDSVERRLDAAATRVARALLLVGEPPLPHPVGRGSTFAAAFQARGPHDSQGRGLRDLDLARRLFRHPLSYLIYSDAFAGLPDALRERVWLQLWLVLHGVLDGRGDPRLAHSDRAEILHILAETWDGELPSYW